MTLKLEKIGAKLEGKNAELLRKRGREKETQESKDYLNNSECGFKNRISAIYPNSQFPYLNV